MKIVKAGYEILSEINRFDILKKIEMAARCCYKSEENITDESSSKLVKSLLKGGHLAMIEHAPSVSVKFICDRGVSHEIVRHRLFSFAQESTRYCNYAKDKHGNQITYILPCWFSDESSQKLIKNEVEMKWTSPVGYPFNNMAENEWYRLMLEAERSYNKLVDEYKWSAQQARSVLPNSLKTEIVVTGNLREWIHFFNLRAIETTGKPHPQMVEVALPLLKEMQQLLPEIFENMEVK